ncbi:MAG: hypothetical protein A3D52_00120 [Candidatus Taylorbacteria bacterium RIFCSPHIGHO2_02_FULL_44_36]|uniref:Uncharacterized protein n=1 Tax=Candidatus Taylorbacteria bacterium RIFCSPLOWO2_12_FULL_44_15c TaxID=1802333 RepID=A0A1G2P6F7_9BACT|nr:MAG: hypothetical protein A3D52_00120 [Candidatus Taylorbacteria bacterium RIFCSPHIGHO2_02_FULL_44_36]OHA38146.1 MAG: hypothetical protein A3I97_01900 [Candidatus Taylorbacteria bacterium RIFCSPLOWO2_02_FULL_44_35]OHA43141.1 MAG: hypothetical protein A3G03_00255 [Candidatus Taylorbacteria bacterium RIFCSPLOWO2_12_FULL_44_15c]
MKKRKSATKKLPPSPEEVERILKGTNWDEYWREVQEEVNREIDALNLAMAKSMAKARDKVFLSV